jgi:hypothetical protein
MAEYCTPITGNISKVCGPKKGGLIKNLYVANFGQMDDAPIVGDEVSAINMKVDALAAPYFWYSLAVKKNTSGFENPAEIGDSKFFNQTVSFTVEGFDTATKLAFESMIDGEAVFIGTTADGTSHMLGRVSGAEMTEGNIGTGVANSDLFGATVTFMAAEIEVTPTITAGVTINVWDDVTAATVPVVL